MNDFSSNQTKFIEAGGLLAAKLNEMVLEALQVKVHSIETKRHTYIFSPPGAGKTYTVQHLADKHKVKLVKIQGSSSMNAFVVKLASAVYANKKAKKAITVWVDDCDSIFTETESLNVMKGALDQERNLCSWNKNLSNIIGTYLKSDNPNEVQIGTALQSFQQNGSVGVEIPTDNVRFIVTSNRPLTAPSADLTSQRKMHEAAIRDRVHYKDFTLNSQKQWGWIAHIAMQANIYNLSQEQKTELLVWMWDNWGRLPATSMRAVNELGAMIINHPKQYKNQWELTLN